MSMDVGSFKEAGP